MCDDEVYSPPIVRPLIIGRVGRKGTLERMHTEPTDGNGASQFTQARAETWGGYSSNNLQPRDRPRWLTEGSYADEPNTIPHPIPQTPPEPGIYEIRNCLTQQNLDSVYKTFAEGELVAERRPNPRSVSQRWEIMPAGMGWTIQNAFNNSYLTLKSPELLYGDQVVQSEFPVSWDLRRAPGGGPEGAQFSISWPTSALVWGVTGMVGEKPSQVTIGSAFPVDNPNPKLWQLICVSAYKMPRLDDVSTGSDTDGSFELVKVTTITKRKRIPSKRNGVRRGWRRGGMGRSGIGA